MIRVTVKLSAETIKALDELTEKINRLTPEQQTEFQRIWLEEAQYIGRDVRSGHWLEQAIAAYERRTGHTL